MQRSSLPFLSAALIALMVGGCGPGDVDKTNESRLRLVASEDVITVDAGSEVIIQVMIVGSAGESTELSSPSLPSFITISGTLLSVRPSFQDAGDFEVPLIATAGDEEATATLRLHVARANTAPRLWSVGILASAMFAEATPALRVVACDEELDDFDLQVKFSEDPPAHVFRMAYAHLPQSDKPGCLTGEFVLEGTNWDDIEWWELTVVDGLGGSATTVLLKCDPGWCPDPQ